jgi:hypothetical protein
MPNPTRASAKTIRASRAKSATAASGFGAQSGVRRGTHAGMNLHAPEAIGCGSSLVNISPPPP